MQLVVRQISGLGNQLFQYAAGLYFSRRYNMRFTLARDQSGAISHGYARPFLLSHFSIQSNIRNFNPVDRLRLQAPRRLRSGSIINKLLGIQLVVEQLSERYSFMPDIALADNIRWLYLIGYWQSYRFAESLGDLLRTEFAFLEPPRGRNLEVIDNIRKTKNSVSLHLRRGDYTLAAEGKIALPMSYYKRAIEFFSKRLSSPTFFIFADEMDFARRNLPPGIRAEFIDHNDAFSAHEDLRLMSACESHIIANSTFSWWGAWLNPRPDKIVYAPKYWLLKPDTYFPDLLPPEWILDENLDG